MIAKSSLQRQGQKRGVRKRQEMAFVSRLGLATLIRRASSKGHYINTNTDAAVVSMQHDYFNFSRNISSSSKLFVGGLSWGVDENFLRDAFASYGTVTKAEIVTDHETGRSKGYGFVSFTSNEVAEAALQGMNGRVWRRPQQHLQITFVACFQRTSLRDLEGRTIRADYAVQKIGGFHSGPRGLKNKRSGYGSSNTSCLDKLSRKENVIGTYGSNIGGNLRNL
ncbi:hypothetical protein O6H91_18G055900 [Diphasiastrum complanatum]|uniref:Uncharacterized protein n=1 Tax=Diphasiastrum complanatum TaxID=34168 RepID=A0ACC2B1P4_DIPCM|nr:hypothetical protein O6H91_18G055900 [Diphasiastrum complanatum]